MEDTSFSATIRSDEDRQIWTQSERRIDAGAILEYSNLLDHSSLRITLAGLPGVAQDTLVGMAIPTYPSHRISAQARVHLPPAAFSAFITSASVDSTSHVSLSVAALSASSDLTNS